MAGLAVLAVNLSFDITGLSVDHLGCFGSYERVFFAMANCLTPDSSSAPPKYDCHWFILYLLQIWHSLQSCPQRKADCIDRQASWTCRVRHSQPSFHTPKGLRPLMAVDLWVKKTCKVIKISFRAVLAWAVMMVFCESFRLLRQVHGGFGGCEGKRPSVCFVKCMAVLADVSVCNLHMLRPTSETQNYEKNKCGVQSGGFDAFGGTQCLKFLRPLMLRGAFGGVGV